MTIRVVIDQIQDLETALKRAKDDGRPDALKYAVAEAIYTARNIQWTIEQLLKQTKP